jgi:hypothetical protein
VWGELVRRFKSWRNSDDQIRSMAIAFRIVPLRSRKRLSDPLAAIVFCQKKIPVKAHC